MDKGTYKDLAIARIERAGELLEEAKELLLKDKYKSANNRAFYSIEKSMKALLATEQITADSHNGVLQQFNVHFIKNEIGGFQRGDYKKVASAERIRNTSDYDDFYIADKTECSTVVETAKEMYQKSLLYMKSSNVITDEKHQELLRYLKD